MPSALLKGTVLCTAMAAALISGCSDDDDEETTNTNSETVTEGETETGTQAEAETASIPGLVVLDSAQPVGEAMGALLTALNNNENITALPLIDHQANADNIGEQLRPTSAQLFGNPALGTPLMQLNQLAGLDLPQKILAWENEDGDTQLAYNSADYLQQRHGITGSETADAALQTISGALDALSFVASGNDVDEDNDAEPTQTEPVTAGAGITTVTSTQDMDATYNALVTSIQAPLILVAQVNHTENAANIGLDLAPTRLLIFGNPNAGTPLMQSGQSIGIDLPQKMLVFEDADGVVTIAYNDPAYLAERHAITDQGTRLTAISAALAALANNAAGIAPAQ